jgi:hypothetical protein
MRYFEDTSKPELEEERIVQGAKEYFLGFAVISSFFDIRSEPIGHGPRQSRFIVMP